jgi:beta,beta-carotene 9',10'-dioxygenase
MTNSSHIGFQSVERTVPEPVGLKIAGELPDWLSGAVLRTGPAQFEVGDRTVNHWFDGLAMIDRFAIAGGKVTYASRMLESGAYRHAEERGEIGYTEFASDPCRGLFKRIATGFFPKPTDNANVNVTRLGDRWIAMTETPLQIEFDPETLETAGVVEYADRRKEHAASAHPHHDAARGELVSFTMGYGARSRYEVYRLPDGERERETLGRRSTTDPSYMHSFALTDRYAVLFEQPLRVNPTKLLLSGRPFIENFKWKPRLGTRFLVFDRDGGGTGSGYAAASTGFRGEYRADAFFTFHQANAFERDGEIVIDVSAYEDNEIVESFYLDRLRAGRVAPHPRLARYRIPLDGDAAVLDQELPEPVELPRIAYRRCSGREHRYVWGAGWTHPDAPWFDALVKVDVEDGSVRKWHEDGCHPGEPVFVAAPHGSAEDDGVILSVVLDAPRELSYLLVLDASSLAELGRAEAPMRLPFGFHAQYAR